MDEKVFADRLNEALRIRGVTPASLSQFSGASEGLISGYRKGMYKPKRNRIERFAEILNVSADWLDGYDVPMGRYMSAADAQRAIEIDELLKALLPEALSSNIASDDEIEDLLNLVDADPNFAEAAKLLKKSRKRQNTPPMSGEAVRVAVAFDAAEETKKEIVRLTLGIEKKQRKDGLISLPDGQ